MMEWTSVEWNPWLRCAFYLGAHIGIPGLAWSWLLARREDERVSIWQECLLSISRVIFSGLLISLVIVLVLAESSRFVPRMHWMAAMGVSLVGIIFGLLINRQCFFRHLKLGVPGVIVLLLGFMAVMKLPNQGEWIVGGWDPGTYVNQGVRVSHSGTFHPGPDPLFSRFSDQELAWFTRPMFNFTEAYPVVPLDRERRSLVPFFFHGTPALIALADRAGGLRAATRINEFVGIMILLVFPAMLLSLGFRGPASGFALIALIFQPVWIYHLHLPTSEMFQLLLLCGIGLLIPLRAKSLFAVFCVALALFAGMVNRFSFLPFGALLLCLLALYDAPREDRGRMNVEYIVYMFALVGGLLFDFAVNALTLARLGMIVSYMMAASVGLFLLMMGLIALGSWRPARRMMQSAADATWPALVVGGLVFIGVFAMIPGHFRGGLVLASAYLGWSAIGLAAVGVILSLVQRRIVSPAAALWMVLLGAASLVTFLIPEITPIYPWLTRRYVEFTIPLLALLAGIGLGWFWDVGKSQPRPFRALAVLLMIGMMSAQAGKAYRAWKCTEFDGLSSVLDRVAREIGSGDIVVADHFRWGVPLGLIYGKQVINGELFYTDPKRFRNALAVLERFRVGGEKILFLTSTDRELSVYPLPVKEAGRQWAAEPVMIRDVIHSPRARDFELKERQKVFALFQWKPN